MADRKVNIDVVFRNGLKDYEAMPPHDIWGEIQPSIKTRFNLPIFVKVAASLAVIFTLAFFSYRLGINSAIRVAENRSYFPSERASLQQTLVQNPVILAENRTAEIKGITYNGSPLEAVVLEVTDNHRVATNEHIDEIFIDNAVKLFGPAKLQDESDPKSQYYTIEEYNSIDFSAQNDNPRDRVEQKWTIAALASPTYYTGTVNNGSQVVLSADEQPSISYAGGVAFSYRINERVSIQSGLYYSNIGQRINGISSYAGFGPINASKGDTPFEVATNSGTIQTDNADIFLADASGTRVSSDYSIDNFDPVKSSLSQIGTSLEQSFRYIEVPLSLRYKVVDGTLGVNLFGGLSSNLLVGNNVYSNNDGVIHYIGKTDGLRGFVISSTFGMGMEYNISKSISLNLEPMLRYYLTPINATSTGTNPFSFGLFSGIAYKF